MGPAVLKNFGIDFIIRLLLKFERKDTHFSVLFASCDQLRTHPSTGSAASV
jgi:hypothetical protein